MHNHCDPKYGETTVKMNPIQIINDLNICVEYLKYTFIDKVKAKLLDLIRFSFGFLSKGEYNEIEINRVIQYSKAIDIFRSNRKNCGRLITYRELESLSSDPNYYSIFGSMMSKVGIVGIEICNLIANPDLRNCFCNFYAPKYIKVSLKRLKNQKV